VLPVPTRETIRKNAAQRLRQKSAFVLQFLAAEAVPDFTKHPHDSVGAEAIEGVLVDQALKIAMTTQRVKALLII
jgi:hypothetical protein